VACASLKPVIPTPYHPCMSHSTDQPDNSQSVTQSRNPLPGKGGNVQELLMDLTDDEIVEWCAGLATQRKRLQAVGQDFGSWMLSTAQSNCYRELERRGFSVQAIDDMIRGRTVPDIPG